MIKARADGVRFIKKRPALARAAALITRCAAFQQKRRIGAFTDRNDRRWSASRRHAERPDLQRGVTRPTPARPPAAPGDGAPGSPRMIGGAARARIGSVCA
jgi:hypothetical protein